MYKIINDYKVLPDSEFPPRDYILVDFENARTLQNKWKIMSCNIINGEGILFNNNISVVSALKKMGVEKHD